MQWSRSLIGLIGACVLCSQSVGAQFGAPPSVPTIYYSVAPWDGAAFDIQIPLPASAASPHPLLRIQVWGNPQYTTSTTLQFPSAGKGLGQAFYQVDVNHPPLRPLHGTVTFTRLEKDAIVTGTYNLSDAQETAFRGEIKAAWGNKPGMIQ